MSDAQLEGANKFCPLDDELQRYKLPYQPDFDFVQEVVNLQAQTSYEELGDNLLGDRTVTSQALARTQVYLDPDHALNIAAAVSECLQERFLGLCSITNCKGKPLVEKFISRVNVSLPPSTEQQ